MNNNIKEYGYIRVSSKTQNVARQIKMRDCFKFCVNTKN